MVLKNINPTTTNAWKALQTHYQSLVQERTESLFEKDPDRANKLSITNKQFKIDFSKNKITPETIRLFSALAEECDLKQNIQAVLDGKLVNETERRSVLHMALRNTVANKYKANGQVIYEDILAVKKQMQTFCNAVHEGKHLGYTNKKITTIVNIGIGGSDLGPLMVAEALKPYWIKGITGYFVSNIDEAHLQEVLQKINPEETLFIIASKTFTTQETITNALTARSWFLKYAKDEIHIKQHFIALSTNAKAVSSFGIATENMFQFWDWVGGRYSLWSAIGMSIALIIGYKHFENVLHGAEQMDTHFIETPFEKNIPFLLAAIGIWHRNFFSYEAHCIMPYNQYLQKFPAYLQQADMESNGKTIDRNQQAVNYATAPIIWGDAGTNGQHSFFQLLHQGSSVIPVDFIAAVNTPHEHKDHQEKLLANFFAQTAALMKGKKKEQVEEELRQVNTPPEQIKFLTPYKIFDGDRPTTSILFQDINPTTLGELIALYEHKILVQGLLWNVFSFDQFGVELGKEMCGKILPDLQSPLPTSTYDSSTNSLITYYKQNKQ